MLNRLRIGIAVGSTMLTLSACSVMIAASGKGDIKRSMENRDRIMNEMGPGERSAYISEKTADTMSLGKSLFAGVQLGRNERSCESCHPGGGTTGSEASVGDVSLPIPSLIGVAAEYPKFSVADNQVVSMVRMIDNCIVLFMDGGHVALDSPEMVAIAMYVTSLSNGREMTGAGEY